MLLSLLFIHKKLKTSHGQRPFKLTKHTEPCYNY